MIAKLDRDWKFRIEYFGGLLTNVCTGEELTFNKDDAEVFFFHSHGLSKERAMQIFKKLEGRDYEGEVTRINFLDEFILEEYRDDEVDEETLIKRYLEEVSAVKGKNYLRAPLEVNIYPTFRCQMNCAFCRYEEKKKQYTEDFSFENLKKVISELKELQVLRLSILGGEPTMYPNIYELLSYLRDIRFKTTLVTNAYNIECVDEVINNDYLSITITLQSVDDVMNKLMTGVSVTSILTNIKRLITARKIVSINTIYTCQSIDELKAIIDFCEANQIQNFTLCDYQETESRSSFSNRQSKLREVYDTLCKYIEAKEYQYVSCDLQGCLIHSAYPELKYHEEEDPTQAEYIKCIQGCEAGRVMLEIMPNGDVYPCYAFSKNSLAEIPNIYTSSLEDIWNNDKTLNMLRSLKTKDTRCKECKFCVFCNGGCPAHNIIHNLSYDRKGDSRCPIRNSSKNG